MLDFSPKDAGFLQDCSSAILQALASGSQPVRVQASWALANLTEALFSQSFPKHELTHSELLVATAAALKDRDMVCRIS